MKECKESRCSEEIQRSISLCEGILCAEICACHGDIKSIFVIFLPHTKTSLQRFATCLASQ